METVSVAMEAWEPFFAAQLGAAAALGGLVFVGLSLNLAKILSFPVLPNRALLALGLLLAILVVSSLLLMPGVPLPVLGVCTLLVGLTVGVFGTAIEIHLLRAVEIQHRTNFIGNLILFELSVLPYIVAGILLLRADLSALYWIAAAIIISFIKAVADAWVLLVEINR
jgi:modulator of FtsH protease